LVVEGEAGGEVNRRGDILTVAAIIAGGALALGLVMGALLVKQGKDAGKGWEVKHVVDQNRP
jgi:hypothetical protein